MIRKSFAVNIAIVISVLAEIYLIVNLFTREKTWSHYDWAVAGFVLLPVSASVYVRRSSLQPVSKVIVLTGVWVAWTILAAIAAFATYYYWYNNPTDTTSCLGGGICFN